MTKEKHGMLPLGYGMVWEMGKRIAFHVKKPGSDKT
jgi:hypothetical protein